MSKEYTTNFDDFGKSICKCKLDDEQILVYDSAVSDKFYKEHKNQIDEDYFSDKRKTYLGMGYVYSVNGVVQTINKKFGKDHFFIWNR
jgi:hypothetical protein